jgi:hypothetical protein
MRTVNEIYGILKRELGFFYASTDTPCALYFDRLNMTLMIVRTLERCKQTPLS